MNSVADKDVYDSRKNRTDRWYHKQKAKYIVGHVGLGLEVPYIQKYRIYIYTLNSRRLHFVIY